MSFMKVSLPKQGGSSSFMVTSATTKEVKEESGINEETNVNESDGLNEELDTNEEVENIPEAVDDEHRETLIVVTAELLSRVLKEDDRNMAVMIYKQVTGKGPSPSCNTQWFVGKIAEAKEIELN